MSKRNIAYIKPEEPSFLRKIKEQVGYKEGPNLDTKRQESHISPEDLEDTNDELPTVVVLKPGDLTAEQADQHVKQIQKEEEEKPADLSAPVVFRPKKKHTEAADEGEASTKRAKTEKKSRKAAKKALLSFDDDEEEY